MYGHQGADRHYHKICKTYYWPGMKTNLAQFISNCKICKKESPNLGKYMNLHLEIGAAPMHFLSMDTIEIRNTKSPYKYTFTLIDVLTKYVSIIPVKDISRKTSENTFTKFSYLLNRLRNSYLIMEPASSTKICGTLQKH